MELFDKKTTVKICAPMVRYSKVRVAVQCCGASPFFLAPFFPKLAPASAPAPKEKKSKSLKKIENILQVNIFQLSCTFTYLVHGHFIL